MLLEMRSLDVLVLYVRVLDGLLYVDMPDVMLGMGVLDVLVLHVVGSAGPGCGVCGTGHGKSDRENSGFSERVHWVPPECVAGIRRMTSRS